MIPKPGMNGTQKVWPGESLFRRSKLCFDLALEYAKRDSLDRAE